MLKSYFDSNSLKAIYHFSDSKSIF